MQVLLVGRFVPMAWYTPLASHWPTKEEHGDHAKSYPVDIEIDYNQILPPSHSDLRGEPSTVVAIRVQFLFTGQW